MIRAALATLARHLRAPQVLYDAAGAPYLSRYYLAGRPTMPDGSAPFDIRGTLRRGVVWPGAGYSLFLHHFHRGDPDEAMHNHPWRWAVSFVLAGGYREERRARGGAVVREVRPFAFSRLTSDDFHRVELLEGDAWTLFLVGPAVQSWGFWDRESGVFTPWREYLARRAARP